MDSVLMKIIQPRLCFFENYTKTKRILWI